jgi:hypothetical protein
VRIIGGSCWKRALSDRFGPARNKQALKYQANHCIMNWIKPLLLAGVLVEYHLGKKAIIGGVLFRSGIAGVWCRTI